MASWVTHLMIADGVLKRLPGLDRRGFCVGNIAPDCNVENEDWTAFTPSREVTHWMRGERKTASDGDAFCKEYFMTNGASIQTAEQYAFLLGYYAHLLTDAAFQAMIRNEDRVKAAWSRIKADTELRRAGTGMEETWDTIKRLIPKQERMREIYALEAEYLRANPDSGYLTEILPLKEFPDYIDYLPHGCIVRKIGVMGYLPEPDKTPTKFIAVSREEFAAFVAETTETVAEKIRRIAETRANRVTLRPMTREMCHEFYKGFQNDPAIGHYYEYVYSAEIADRYFDHNAVSDRKLFAILVGDQIVGECKLKNIDFDKRECSMGIHLRDDSVKEKGYGTQAERLILRYAFEEMGMAAVNADAVLKNTRSQHVLEKVGFRYTHEDETFKYYRCEVPSEE